MKKSSSVSGLMLYALYSAGGNAAILLVMAIAANLVMLVTGIYTFFTVSLAFGVAVLPCAFMMSAHKDSASKWNRFQLAIPVRRNDVITSRYLAHLLMLLAGIALTVLFVGISTALHEGLAANVKGSALFLSPFCIGVSLTACAAFYPALYTIGENKEETLSIVCLVVASAFGVLLQWIGRELSIAPNITAAACIAIPLVLFVTSYAATTRIYAKKDS